MKNNCIKSGYPRRKTKTVQAGDLLLGSGYPVAIQSMTNTDTRDVKSSVAQVRRLQKAGCELVRLAVPDREAALALKAIKAKAGMPLAADIHFDYRLALLALEAGIDKLRLNPGNIGAADHVRKVVKEAKARSVPIRIGVNAGSLEKDILARDGHPTARGMVESALRHVRILEGLDFDDIVISLKGSDVPMTILAYRLMVRIGRLPVEQRVLR